MCRIRLIGAFSLALFAGCVPALCRDRYEVRSDTEREWRVRSVFVEQTSIPGKLQDLGEASVILELADGRRLRVEIESDMRPPRATLQPCLCAYGSRVRVREIVRDRYCPIHGTYESRPMRTPHYHDAHAGALVPEGVRYETNVQE